MESVVVISPSERSGLRGGLGSTMKTKIAASASLAL